MKNREVHIHSPEAGKDLLKELKGRQSGLDNEGKVQGQELAGRASNQPSFVLHVWVLLLV